MQFFQTNARNSVQQAQESYAEDDVGGGGVARCVGFLEIAHV